MIPLLQVRNLRKQFGHLQAVDDVCLNLFPGKTFGLVGESGCGKSTLAKTILRLHEPTSGSILYDGKEVCSFSPRALKAWRRETGIVFQDPYSSLNPRMTAEDILREPFQIHGIPIDEEKIVQLLRQVGLNPFQRRQFPHEFSGGQRQRIGIARALALTPRLVVCDEPIAALDVSVQAQIVNLLKTLQKELGLAYLFISHDLRMVKYISDHVGVMYLGGIVESAPAADLFREPLHPYTQALLSAIPIPDPAVERKRSRIVLSGEVPSPLNPPKGCPFSTRCPKAMDICRTQRPPLKEPVPHHQVRCHL